MTKNPKPKPRSSEKSPSEKDTASKMAENIEWTEGPPGSGGLSGIKPIKVIQFEVDVKVTLRKKPGGNKTKG